MAVRTLKEFEKLKQKSTAKAVEGEKSPELLEVIEPEFEYVFFYPDNRANAYHNGTYRLTIEDKIVERPIVDGVIKVYSLKEKEILLNDGFLFLRKQEVKE